MKKQIKIGVTSERKMNLEFIDAWKKAAKNRFGRAQERLYFLDVGTLLKTLSDQRLHLLQVLHAQGTLTIRQLSLKLKRDYKNVYNDVHLLLAAGLIHQEENGLIFTPWDKIQTEIDLVA